MRRDTSAGNSLASAALALLYSGQTAEMRECTAQDSNLEPSEFAPDSIPRATRTFPGETTPELARGTPEETQNSARERHLNGTSESGDSVPRETGGR